MADCRGFDKKPQPAVLSFCVYFRKIQKISGINLHFEQ